MGTVSQRRLQEATCHVHAGDPELALHIMSELLADEMSRFPEDDARLVEVRRQIGELEVGVGDVDKARVTLTDLRTTHQAPRPRPRRDHPRVRVAGKSFLTAFAICPDRAHAAVDFTRLLLALAR